MFNNIDNNGKNLKKKTKITGNNKIWLKGPLK